MSRPTPPIAAAREVEYGIGVVVALEVFVGTYYLHGGDKRDNLASVYKARGVSGPYVADPNEVLGLEWLNPDKLPLALMPDARAVIPDFCAGRRGVVRLWRDGMMPWTG